MLGSFLENRGVWRDLRSNRRRAVRLAGPLALVGVMLSAGPNDPQAAPLEQASTLSPTAGSPERALIDRYCIGCHNQDDAVAGLALDTLDPGNVAGDAETWEKVARKLRGRMMPPMGLPRPDPAQLDRFVASLESALDRAATGRPNPGPRAGLHRLNRTEYGNAVRDLLDLEIDVSELLPADDESHGFDNIAEVLRVSPSLLEQYLSASRKISSLAVGDPGTMPISHVFRAPPDLAQDKHIEGLPFGTRGGILIRHNFPVDAEYDFSVFLLRNIVGYMTGLEWPHRLEITIDGERVFLAPVGGEEDNRMSDENFAAAANAIDARLRARIPVTAGPHEVGVTFLRKNSAETHEPLELHTRDLDLQNMNGIPVVDYVDITGPFNPTGPGDTPSRSRIFTCRPAGPDEEDACAEEILATLARRVYRRPLGERDIETLLDVYKDGRSTGGFEAGIQNALRLILASPGFIFRSEPDPADMAPGTIHPLPDLALASRLSFFLWSSIPDDELIRLAVEGRLSDRLVLGEQLRRMLKDPRSQALVENFAGQWLFLRNLESVTPDQQTFPNFDDNLRKAFRTETELFFASIMREDRSVLDLLDADYTFLNERLAFHYGIPNIYGSHFRRVKLAQDARRGLLGQGSILTVTSYPNRTSPVLRGKWILENLLGTPPPPPPPPPPPDVPALEESEETDDAPLSVRERLEQHRRDPACAGCHAVMDPLGFALETFDAVGRRRTREEGGAIDASGQLADGTPIEGPVTLRRVLLERPDQFAGTLTEKLLTYALGRGLEYYDMPVVRKIVNDAARDDYRFSSIILGIVESVPFRMKMKKDEQPRD